MRHWFLTAAALIILAGVKGDAVGKIEDKVVHQAHMVIGVKRGKLYPVTDKNFVVGEDNSEIQGNAEGQG